MNKMWTLLKKPIWKWGIAFILSATLHLLFGYYYFYKREMTINELLTSAVIIDFSEQPQSITISELLPVGAMQQISQETRVEDNEPELTEAQIQETLSVEQPTPPEVEPEIVVKQQPQQPKNPLKIDEQSKVQHKSVKTEKTKKMPKSKTEPSKNQVKKREKKSTKVAPIAQRATPAGNNTTTAPPANNSNRIAAKFESNNQGQTLLPNWRALVSGHLQRRLKYPEQALKKQWQGSPLLDIQIDNQGRVLNITLIKSSGRSVLDKGAITTIQKASPLPPPPAQLITGNSLRITVPVHFNYETYQE